MSKQDLIQKFNTKYKGKTITATELPELADDLCAIIFEKYCADPIKDMVDAFSETVKRINEL